jgi:hypothetical protein
VIHQRPPLPGQAGDNFEESQDYRISWLFLAREAVLVCSADAAVKHGHKVPAVNLWIKGEPAARLPFEKIGSDLTPYAFLQIFP